MSKREETRAIKIGSLTIGGSNHVLVQSMASIKTSNVKEVSEQINRCAKLGAELMRLSVLDFEDAKAFKEIKKAVSIPLIADIHIDYRLALEAINAGVDAIRINPGNIGDEVRIKKVVDACKKHHIPIRVGVNGGSLDKSIYSGKETIRGEQLFKSIQKHVSILEKYGFYDIVLSLKGSDPLETANAYRLAAAEYNYPLHLGVTEAGPMDVSLIRTTASIAPLLIEGIGDTIRFSLSEEPEEEIKAAMRLLKDLGLREDWPTLISCPTCGRTRVNLIPLAKKVLAYLEEHHISKTIAIMGCVVNGPGEAKHADIGVAGGNGVWVIFKKGKAFKTVNDDEVYAALIKEISQL